VTDIQHRDPAIGIKGKAYVSLFDGNLFIKVGEKTIFDLTEQDARDTVDALRQVVPDPRPTEPEARAYGVNLAGAELHIDTLAEASDVETLASFAHRLVREVINARRMLAEERAAATL